MFRSRKLNRRVGRAYWLRGVASGGFLVASAFGGTAQAQDRVQPQDRMGVTPSADANTSGIGTADATLAFQEDGEIVVTAQKRSESAARVPIAMNVINGDSLREQGIASVADLQNITTGLAVTRTGFGLNLNIRGVTTTDTSVKGSQGIAYTVDGVPINRPQARGVAFFDIERVEVLRGPQGTLYGSSTTGGAVNVITKAPGPVLSASGRVEIGNYDTRRAEFAVNLPLGDRFAFRIAGNINDRNGYLYPVDGSPARGGQSDRTVRASLRGELSDDITARITVTAGHIGGNRVGGVPLGTFSSQDGRAQRALSGNPFRSSVDDNFFTANWELQAVLGSAQITYLGSRQIFNLNEVDTSTNDPTGNAPAPSYVWSPWRVRDRTDSHELRISNADPGRIDYVVGANYMREPLRENYHSFAAPLNDPTVSGSISTLNAINRTVLKSAGLFGQVTFHLNDILGLVAGVRYSKDEVRRTGTFSVGNRNVDGQTCVAPNDCVGGPNNGFQSASKFTYRLGFNAQLDPSNLVYGSVSTGYKPGGFNDFDPATGQVGTYEPESLRAYELGYKGRLFDNLRFDSSIFYYDYSLNQISSLVLFPLTSGGVVGVIYTRAASTEVKGWENELTYTVAPRTSITARAALLNSQYRSLRVGLFRQIDWRGERLDSSPSFVGSIGVNHAFELSNGAELRLRAFSKYSSSYLLSDLAQAQRFKQKGYTRSDISVTYAAPGDKYYVQAFVENIEDALQATQAPSFNAASLAGNLNASTVGVTTPRFFGIRFGFNFQ